MDTKPKSDKLRNIVNKECLFPLSAYSACYIQEDGKFADIIDKDITMISEGIGRGFRLGWMTR